MDAVNALLVRAGFDINQANKFGYTPFFVVGNHFIQRSLLFQNKLIYEANSLFFSQKRSVFFEQRKEAMKDFDAVAEFCLCV